MNRPAPNPQRNGLTSRLFSIVALVGMLTMLLGPALRVSADNISNSLDATIDAATESMNLVVGNPDGSTTYFVDPTNGDGKNGCNLTGSTALVVAVNSSSTGVATVNPTSLAFDSCGAIRQVSVHAVAQGSSTISLSLTSNNSGGTFNLTPATFTVTVTSSNTSPTVSVTGVANGASYNKGSVLAAGCDVVDTEDGKAAGNLDFAATLSAITGPYSADSIGAQTASCAYTDGGGLPSNSSATYAIVDPTAPVIGYVLSPAGPDGNNGWYRSNVSLTWTVVESESPSSLAKTGCINQNITADQAATTYSCSASSAGGSAAQVDVTIKRDATAPTISSTRTFTSDGTAYTGGWTKFKVTVLYSCNDNGGSGGSGSNALESVTPVQTDGQVFNGAVYSTQKCVDPAGNESAFGVSDIVKVDKVDPIVSPGDVTDMVWRNSSLSQNYTASDIDSGLADPADAAFTVTAAGESTLDGNGDPIATTSSHTVLDVAGNSTTRTVSALIDTTDPIITASATNADNSPYAGAWTNQTVTVHFTCSDELSGISDACPDDVVIDSDTPLAGQSVSGFVSDNAGNSASSTAILVQVDKTGPDITASATTADSNAYTGGWTNLTVTVHFECSDALSGLGESCPDEVVIDSDTPFTGLPVSGTVTDRTGNSSTSNEILVNVDKTAPNISAFATTSDSNAYGGGWTNQTVTVAFTCSDALSGIPAGVCPADVVIDIDTAFTGQSVQGSVADNAGNSASTTPIVVMLDKTDPSITGAATTADSVAYLGGWTNQTVTVHFICSDALSGINAACPDDVVIDSDTSQAGQSVSGFISDNAGNSASSTAILVQVDKTGPAITASAKTADNNAYSGGWTNQTVTVHFTCSDDLSGIPAGACPAEVVIDSNTGPAGQTVSSSVTDTAGNIASSNEIVVSVDKSAPVITSSAKTADNSAYTAGWTNQTVTVHFDCSDSLSGLGEPCPDDVVIDSDTTLAGQSITGSVIDNAGNVASTAPIVVQVDKTAPTIALASIKNADNSTYVPGAGNWTNQDVTVTWTCADALSGPALATASDIRGEGENQSAHGTCLDTAGNSASSNQGDINIDKTKPTNVALSFGPSFYFGSVPALPTTCTASDVLSGLASCTVALRAGDDGQSVGPHTLVGTGSDKAGNTQSAEFGYAVLGWNTGGFYQPVSMLPTKVNTIKGGQTVPLKFEVFAGPFGQNEQTSTAAISGFAITKMTCETADVLDPVDFVTTGGTSLRYDSTAGQFIQNWKTPTTLGCYRVTVTMIDGSKISADFKVTK